MSFLLDTNTIIFALKGDDAVLSKLQHSDPGELSVSTISLAELWFGALKTRHPKRMRKLQDAFLAPIDVLGFDQPAAEEYATIRRHLERRGTPIGERDQLIASIARATARTVVTNNVAEFRRVPNLEVVDWTLGRE